MSVAFLMTGRSLSLPITIPTFFISYLLKKIKKGTLEECISGVPRRSAEKEFFCSLAVLCNNPSVAENSSVLYLKYTKYKTFQSRRIGELFYFRSLSQ